MKDFNPRVTIVIPVYNGSKYLAEAIDSALAQTYKNLEIIVSNDGSNDNGATSAVAKSYGDKIIFLDKKENGGASTALNAAIKVMTGEYFSWLSHDDKYYPNKIQRQVEELSKLQDKNTIMMSDLDGINEKRELIYKTNYKNHIKEHPQREKSFLHPVVYNQTHGCTLLIPKVCFDEVGLFDVGERVAQDFECFYRIFKKYPHKLVPEVLVTARDTSNRMGRRAKPRASLEYSRLYIRMLENLSDEDVELLAKDKFTLLSDMWGFFKAAGYIEGFDYASKKIVDHTPDFCIKQIEGYLHGQSSRVSLTDALKVVEKQLSLVFGDKKRATRYVDNVIRGYVVGEKEGLFVNTLNRAIVLQGVLVAVGYKQSAAHLLKRAVKVLKKQKDNVRLENIIADKIVGDKKFLKNNEIDILLDSRAGKKKRIMFCSTHWLTGGMERVMSLVFDQLKDNYDIYLFTPSDGRSYEIALPEYVKHIKISNSVFYNNYDSAALSTALLIGVDVLVGFYNLFEKQLSLYDLCREEGIKTIASNHEYFYYPYFNYDLHGLAVKRLETFKNVDAVIWPTNFSAAVSALSAPNSYWMPNPNTFKVTDSQEKEKENVIICAGRFNDYIKRADRILRAFKIVQDKLPNSQLLVVGDCDRRKKNDLFGGKSIDDMIVELGLDENNITFAGKVSNIGDYYARAKVLVLASGSEGFGMVINEAASYGVPTVYNSIPGLEDLVVDGENGFVVDQDDIGGMAEKLVTILSDNSLLSSMSSSAKKLVQRFDADIIGKKWNFLISNLLEHKNSHDLHRSLETELAYAIKDQNEFSKILFSEFDKMSRLMTEMETGTVEFIEQRAYLKRLSRSLRENGKKRTIRKIAGKVYRKTKSIVKM